MDITFSCSKCGQQLEVDESGAGLTVPCPKCGESLTIPSVTAPNKSPAATSGTSHATTSNRKTLNLALVTTAIVFVLVALGAIVLLLMGRSGFFARRNCEKRILEATTAENLPALQSALEQYVQLDAGKEEYQTKLATVRAAINNTEKLNGLVQQENYSAALVIARQLKSSFPDFHTFAETEATLSQQMLQLPFRKLKKKLLSRYPNTYIPDGFEQSRTGVDVRSLCKAVEILFIAFKSEYETNDEFRKRIKALCNHRVLDSMLFTDSFLVVYTPIAQLNPDVYTPIVRFNPEEGKLTVTHGQVVFYKETSTPASARTGVTAFGVVGNYKEWEEEEVRANVVNYESLPSDEYTIRCSGEDAERLKPQLRLYSVCHFRRDIDNLFANYSFSKDLDFKSTELAWTLSIDDHSPTIEEPWKTIVHVYGINVVVEGIWLVNEDTGEVLYVWSGNLQRD